MTSKLTITDERLAELVAFKPLPGTDINSATRDEWMAMAAELQERRKADSEPVAEVVSIYGDPEAFGEREIRPLVGIQQMPYGTKLYRHAQTAPVVPDDVSGPLAHAYKELTPTFMRNHIAVFERYGIAPNDSSTVIQALRIALDGIERRAAMLQAGNSPVIPEGYVMVPNEPTEAMINAWLSEVANWRGHVAGYKAMLAAAPQEVKGE